MSRPVATAPRVGLWGVFDNGRLSDLARERVITAELERRLGAGAVRRYGPLGRDRPLPADGGLDAEPLGVATPERRAQLAADLDLAVVTGDVLASDETLARLYGTSAPAVVDRHPSALFLGRGDPDLGIVWFAVTAPADLDSATAASVRTMLPERRASLGDEPTRLRLAAAGIDLAGCQLDVEPLALLGRHLDQSVLRRRAQLLRLLGCLPASSGGLVIEVPPDPSEAVVGELLELARAFGERAVLVADDPTWLARALAHDVSGVRSLPATAGLDDLAAALNDAAAVVAATTAMHVLASAIGAPAVPASAITSGTDQLTQLLMAPRRGRSAPPEPDGSRLLSLLDAEFERVAAWARDAAAARGTTVRSAAVEQPAGTTDTAVFLATLDVLRQRLVDERTVLQSEISRLEARLDRITGSLPYRAADSVVNTYRRVRRHR